MFSPKFKARAPPGSTGIWCPRLKRGDSAEISSRITPATPFSISVPSKLNTCGSQQPTLIPAYQQRSTSNPSSPPPRNACTKSIYTNPRSMWSYASFRPSKVPSCTDLTTTVESKRYPYKSNGYMSEPEQSDRLKMAGQEVNYWSASHPVKSGSPNYKNQPGKIEDYVPGKSSVVFKDQKEEFEKLKHTHPYQEGYLSRALKVHDYDSDSNLVFRKKEDTAHSNLSPSEQKAYYKYYQSGGEPPYLGFRKPAPERSPKSPNRFYKSDINIHYKSPILYEYKKPIPEKELAEHQAELMKKLYEEEKREKYLKELRDINARRHTDNFTPMQKSPIPLNRYDDFHYFAPEEPTSKIIARALFNYQGQSVRELTFKKGDLIIIRRQIDDNWYEGIHDSLLGLLPKTYVEVLTTQKTIKKSTEGLARAKFNFRAQTAIELSLEKGELVTLTKRVDANWFEGKIANRKGIFPCSYVEVLKEIGTEEMKVSTQSITTSPPVKESTTTYTRFESARLPLDNHVQTTTVQKNKVLHIDTDSEPIVYRALYKYRPQNNDELELQEGDLVYVLETCDDGWYVGTSQRTGYFGTFPGNYVERVS